MSPLIKLTHDFLFQQEQADRLEVDQLIGLADRTFYKHLFINYFDLDVQFNSFPVSNEVKSCQIFHKEWVKSTD